MGKLSNSGPRNGPIDPVCVAGYCRNLVIMARIYNIYTFIYNSETVPWQGPIWYGTFMLKYLLVEWTDFWSVCWFELSLSRTWFPVNGVLFLSAVFEKLARTYTAILAHLCPVCFAFLHVKCWKLLILVSRICLWVAPWVVAPLKWSAEIALYVHCIQLYYIFNTIIYKVRASGPHEVHSPLPRWDAG